MISRLLIFVLFIAFSSGYTINAQKTLKKADKQFDLRVYDLAIVNYLEALEEDPANEFIKIQLAECFRLSNQHLEALRWFERASKTHAAFNSKIVLNYAHTLKSLGLYNRAKEWYWKYKLEEPMIGEHYALSCDYAKNILDGQEKYQVLSYELNSAESDFGTGFFKETLVFSSFDLHANPDSQKKNRSYVQKPGNQLYAENSAGDATRRLRSRVKEEGFIGPVSYSRNGKLVAFTKNNFINGYEQVYEMEDNLSIFYAITDITGDFETEIAFPFNSSEFANAFPNLSFNGNAMYFSSNRPGGFGGFDIYVSYFKNGEWIVPENLGAMVNSKGNEITPFFDGKTLYFSSDYHHGLGGYDIFETNVSAGKWRYPENMGKGINSPSDEYYPARKNLDSDFYFTSNRMGGMGKDDIYFARPVYEDIADLETNSQENNPFVPKTVSLANLKSNADENEMKIFPAPKMEAEISNANVNVEKSETDFVNSNLEPKASFVAYPDNSSLSLIGARKISLGEIVKPKDKVYFIQLAALSKNKADMQKFKTLASFGNLYKAQQTNFVKIKLGYYLDRGEANEVLKEVKQNGYPDAFITFENMNSGNMELIAGNDVSLETRQEQWSNVNSKTFRTYKVRLASYSDPLWFDINKVKDLGKIEQWTKGSWTIFVLSGFSSKTSAENAKTLAVSRGFRDAEIVVDNKGILQRM